MSSIEGVGLRAEYTPTVNSDDGVFFVAKATDIHGSREIVEKSDQFISEYLLVERGREFVLPVDDLRLLYDMEAWLYPGNYRDSELKSRKVSMDGNGRITLDR